MKKQLVQNSTRSSPSLHVPIDIAPSPRRENEAIALLSDPVFERIMSPPTAEVELYHSKDIDTDLIQGVVQLQGGIVDSPADEASVSGCPATRNIKEQQDALTIQQSQTPVALPSYIDGWNLEAGPLEQGSMGDILSAQAPESPESLISVPTSTETDIAINGGTVVPSTGPAVGPTTFELVSNGTLSETYDSSLTKEVSNDLPHVNGNMEQDVLNDDGISDDLHLPAASTPNHRPLKSNRNSSASMNGDGGPQHSDPRTDSKPESRLPSGKIPQKHLTCYYWKTKGNCRYKEEDCQFAHYYTGIDVDMPSAKNTTCYWWWNNNFCRFSNEDCRFAHYDTGIYADRPGQGSWSGRSLCY